MHVLAMVRERQSTWRSTSRGTQRRPAESTATRGQTQPAESRRAGMAVTTGCPNRSALTTRAAAALQGATAIDETNAATNPLYPPHPAATPPSWPRPSSMCARGRGSPESVGTQPLWRTWEVQTKKRQAGPKKRAGTAHTNWSGRRQERNSSKRKNKGGNPKGTLMTIPPTVA